MMRTTIVLLLFSLLLAACAGSDTSQTAAGSITVKDAWARPAMKMDMGEGTTGSSNGAAYMILENKGDDADRLIRVEGDIAESIELHQTTVQDNVMAMSPVEAIEVPAKGQVELKPGGFHVMLIGLEQDLKMGDRLSLTLVFEKAGKITVEAEVKNP